MEWWKATGICAALFLFLSPGFILTLPPVKDSTKGFFNKGLIHSLETSNASIIAHTVVFVVLAGGLLALINGSSKDRAEEVLKDSSTVLIINTEGATDPINYNSIIGED